LDLFLFEEPFQLTSSNFQNQIWVRYEIDRIVWSNRKSKYTIMHISQDQFHKIKHFYNWICDNCFLTNIQTSWRDTFLSPVSACSKFVL
jgi:hypothetical protein